MSVPVVTDSNRSFLVFLVPFGINTFSTEDSEGVRAGRVSRLCGDVRVGILVVLILLVGDGSSATCSVRLPLLARGVGAGVGGWTLLRCVVGGEGGGGGGGGGRGGVGGWCACWYASAGGVEEAQGEPLALDR